MSQKRAVVKTLIGGSGTFGRRRLGAALLALDIWAPGLSGARFFFSFVFL